MPLALFGAMTVRLWKMGPRCCATTDWIKSSCGRHRWSLWRRWESCFTEALILCHRIKFWLLNFIHSQRNKTCCVGHTIFFCYSIVPISREREGYKYWSYSWLHALSRLALATRLSSAVCVAFKPRQQERTDYLASGKWQHHTLNFAHENDDLFNNWGNTSNHN